jgi:predicted ribosome quality control (RQC) complex YloA/Tae2 family protein
MKQIEIAINKKNITFYIGKNAKDNFDILDISKSEDIWFHSDEYSSCHVIAKINDMKLSKKEERIVIKNGCILCKTNTNKIKKVENIEIIYTYVKNVKKDKIPGRVACNKTKSLFI